MNMFLGENGSSLQLVRSPLLDSRGVPLPGFADGAMKVADTERDAEWEPMARHVPDDEKTVIHDQLVATRGALQSVGVLAVHNSVVCGYAFGLHASKGTRSSKRSVGVVPLGVRVAPAYRGHSISAALMQSMLERFGVPPETSVLDPLNVLPILEAGGFEDGGAKFMNTYGFEDHYKGKPHPRIQNLASAIPLLRATVGDVLETLPDVFPDLPHMNIKTIDKR